MIVDVLTISLISLFEDLSYANIKGGDVVNFKGLSLLFSLKSNLKGYTNHLHLFRIWMKRKFWNMRGKICRDSGSQVFID